MKILVIDDEPFVRKGIVSLVPYDTLDIQKVIECDNGERGLQLTEQELPDIILCDINMPKVNGLDFASEVKARWPWIKIAMITGYDYFEYARKALSIGVEEYILKPVSKEDIVQVILKLKQKIQEDAKIQAAYETLSQQKSDHASDVTGYREQIDTLMQENLDNEEFSLSVLSDHLGLNDSYLSTLFKKIYGTSFSDCLLSLRMEKSKLLLLATDLKNYEIAQKVGIPDPNYFSTVFKKYFGESPNQYKKKVRG